MSGAGSSVNPGPGGPVGPEPPVDLDDSQIFEVRNSEGKGLGCFAKRDIGAGEAVLSEKWWDDQYDRDLLEACRSQGLLSADAEHAPPHEFEPPEHAILSRRIELLRKLEWMPALFFAILNLAAYFTHVAEALVETDVQGVDSREGALIALEQAEQHLLEAIEVGTRLWGDKDVFVWETHDDLNRNRRRMARIRAAQGVE
ncbi:hypothetical protein F5Y05DRAFT_412127 [Hypoxylon sp. FL0543]|nr:hypothetical protein F5Y05DRAFT_412127 [Hypoxylon sp. FL0543]